MQNPEAKIGIYDKEGNLIGEKARGGVNKKEDILKSVIILAMNNNNEIWVADLGESSLYEEALGGSAAGLVRVDEGADEAAKRTAERELGIDFKPEFVTSEYNDEQGIKRHANFYYIKADKNEFNMDEERENGEWKSREEIENNLDKYLPTFKIVFDKLK